MDKEKLTNMIKQAYVCFGAVEYSGARNSANMYNGFSLLERAIKELETDGPEDTARTKQKGEQ